MSSAAACRCSICFSPRCLLFCKYHISGSNMDFKPGLHLAFIWSLLHRLGFCRSRRRLCQKETLLFWLIKSTAAICKLLEIVWIFNRRLALIVVHIFGSTLPRTEWIAVKESIFGKRSRGHLCWSCDKLWHQTRGSLSIVHLTVRCQLYSNHMLRWLWHIFDIRQVPRLTSSSKWGGETD